MPALPYKPAQIAPYRRMYIYHRCEGNFADRLAVGPVCIAYALEQGSSLDLIASHSRLGLFRIGRGVSMYY